MFRLIATTVFACLASTAAWAQVNVTTYHNDNARTGQNLNESILTTTTVNSNTFGLAFVLPVDGSVYAQPLYLSNVTIGGNAHNVVFVATEHDSVYAFDADSSGAPLWQTSFINPPAVTTLDSNNDAGCGDLVPEIGISGTPVIDTNSNTLYVVANTKENGAFFQRLHALDITTGQEKFGGPVVIQATVAGTGDGNSNGSISFDPLKENQRPALLLQNGAVYISWASHCDIGPYHGWIMAYDAASLQQTVVWNATPNGGLGGIWQSGEGPAADANSIYVVTGNGDFTFSTGGTDFGDTILNLGPPSGGTLPLVSYYTPFDQANLAGSDTDLGSGGPLLLPDLPAGSAHQHLLTHAGKEGRVSLVDRDNMGGYNSSADTQIVQELPGAVGGVWGMPAYWNGNVYYGGSNDNLKAFSFNAGGSGLLSTSPTSYSAISFSYPGPTPSISANGSANAILWAIQTDAYGSGGSAVLHAYDATNLATELYNSTQNTGDAPGGAVKFSVPTIANGKVYVGTTSQLAVYSMLQPATVAPVFSPAGGIYKTSKQVSITSATAGATIYYTTDGSMPTTSSRIYSSPVTIRKTGTLRAMAVSSGLRNSGATSGLYTIQTAAGNGPIFLNGFTSNGLTLNGNAAIVSARLRLTNGNGGQDSSVFFNSPVNTQYFTSDFKFQLTNAGADGFTICIQNQGLTALGSSGGGLGYATDGGNGGSVITNSVAIKFDLYNNAGEGTDSTGIYTDGAPPTQPSVDLTSSGIDLHSGHLFRARLNYYNPYLLLEIVDTTEPTKYFATTFTIDIPSTVGGNTAYVGFTGGTGGLTAIQDIVTWDHLSYAHNVASLPTFNPPAGTYTGTQKVSITDTTPGETIYYTTDGKTPTTSSTQYTKPIVVGRNKTIKAIAVASGYLKSSVAVASYTIQ